MKTLLFAGLLFLSLLAPSPAAGRRVEVLFLGDDGHHKPRDRFKQLTASLGVEGINLTFTADMADVNAATLAQYDAVLVYANTTEISPQQETALMEYVEAGHGFVPLHCASYCFLNSPKYLALVGGRFKSHGTGDFETKIVAPEHPVMKGFAGFKTWDETYVHEKLSGDRTVLQTREDEPYTWTRTQGKGRVFYTAYGHDEKTFGNAGFVDLVKRGILWSVNDAARAEWTKLDLKPLRYEKADLPNYEKRNPPPMAQEALTPERSMTYAQVPADMALSLVAAEPNVINPIALAWDARGRLWVLETLDYPNNLQARNLGHDRLKICEDTNGDGKADKFTVFADKLSIPTTMVFSNDGVIITDGADVTFLKDTNGDDVADVRKVLFTGFGMGDTHASSSNFRYGVDNWIYGTVGYSGFNGEVGGERVQFSSGAFRFRPDGSKIEFLQSTTNNTWGLGITEEGNIVGSTANGNPSWSLSFPQRFYKTAKGLTQGKTPRADVTRDSFPITRDVRQVDVWGGFTAAAGHAIYTARNYPKRAWNRLAMICEPTAHLLYWGVCEPDGAGFKTTNGGNVFASADAWSSPVAAEVGPDGAVWICDWYNLIIQHNPTPTRDRSGIDAPNGKGNAYVTALRDQERGRIYRIAWKNAKPAAPLKLAKADAAGLLAALKNDNQLWRLHAQRLLVERANKDVVPALQKLALDPAVDELGLNVGAIHALWTLHGLGAIDASITPALKHASAAVRQAAVNVLPHDAAFAAMAGPLLTDKSAPVVRDTLLALSECPASADAGRAVFAARTVNPALTKDAVLTDATAVAAVTHAPGFLRAALAASPKGAGTTPVVQENPNLFPNASFEEVENGLPKGWGRFVYQGARGNDDPKFEVVAGGRSGKCLQITSTTGSDSGLKVNVKTEKGAEYELSAWIKTKDLATRGGAHGALLNIEGEANEKISKAVKGTADWTQVTHRFRAQGGSVAINCLFGGYGQSTGTAWWDDVSLRKIGAGTDPGTDLEKLVALNFKDRAPAPALAEFITEVKASGAQLANPLLVAFGAVEGKKEAAADLGEIIVLNVIPHQLIFDKKELRVRAGKRTTIRFTNACDLPHNLVLGAPGSLDAIGAASDILAADPKAIETGYVPAGPLVLARTRLLTNKETADMTLPDLKPGKYPYICTFPGHWRVMNGVLIVE